MKKAGGGNPPHPGPVARHAFKRRRAPWRVAQVVNDVPQPQEDFAFGLLNLKPEPVMAET